MANGHLCNSATSGHLRFALSGHLLNQCGGCAVCDNRPCLRVECDNIPRVGFEFYPKNFWDGKFRLTQVGTTCNYRFECHGNDSLNPDQPRNRLLLEATLSTPGGSPFFLIVNLRYTFIGGVGGSHIVFDNNAIATVPGCAATVTINVPDQPGGPSDGPGTAKVYIDDLCQTSGPVPAPDNSAEGCTTIENLSALTGEEIFF